MSLHLPDQIVLAVKRRAFPLESRADQARVCLETSLARETLEYVVQLRCQGWADQDIYRGYMDGTTKGYIGQGSDMKDETVVAAAQRIILAALEVGGGLNL
jgi:hypothetical protein